MPESEPVLLYRTPKFTRYAGIEEIAAQRRKEVIERRKEVAILVEAERERRERAAASLASADKLMANVLKAFSMSHEDDEVDPVEYPEEHSEEDEP